MKYEGCGKVWEVSAGQTKEFQSESDNFLIFQCRAVQKQSWGSDYNVHEHVKGVHF